MAAALFATAIIYSALHLIFRVPVPELVLDDKNGAACGGARC